MSLSDLVVAILAGIMQGIVEWLPISSQGNISLFLTLIGISPDAALHLALFLQLGTTASSALYYREDIAVAVEAAPSWRPRSAFEGPNAVTSFVVVASLSTGLVGVPLYLAAIDVASELTGGLFIALIGVLLLLTGALQLATETVDFAKKSRPTFADALVVGALQGLAILPGVSRSAMTTSGLIFRSHEAPSAFRLSFLLSIPAGVGAAVLTLFTSGGLPELSPFATVVALVTSALVGYVMIGTLMRLVEQIPFWLVCLGLGSLAVIGGGLVSIS